MGFSAILSFLATTTSLVTSQPQVTGIWSSPFELPVIAVAMANLPDGKVLMWASNQPDDSSGPVNNGVTWATVWDPNDVNGSTAQKIDWTNHDMLCPGTTLLADGRVLISGGAGGEQTTIYNPHDDTWEPADTMKIGRGYQTNAMMQDGSVFTLGGSWYGGFQIPGDLPSLLYDVLFFIRYFIFGWFFDLFIFKRKDGEIWDASSEEWRLLPKVKSKGSLLTKDRKPHLRDNHMWLFTAPNGNLFHAGPSKMMHWIYTDGDGGYEEVGYRGNDHSMNGNAVMYDIGKLLCLGGAPDYEQEAKSNSDAFVIDINNGSSVNSQRVGSLHYARTMSNSVALPNGAVVVIGGVDTARIYSEQGTVYATEMWNSDDQQFHLLADIDIPRTYHSSAILLKDGRVLAAGGGLCGDCGVNRFNGQVLTPPYLYDANGNLASRPVIVDAPDNALPGDIISVETGSPIDRLVLMRLSAATHAINTDARRIPLVVTTTNPNFYSAQIPGSAAVALPGPYFLFALDANGVPSIASTLTIGTVSRRS